MARATQLRAAARDQPEPAPLRSAAALAAPAVAAVIWALLRGRSPVVPAIAAVALFHVGSFRPEVGQRFEHAVFGAGRFLGWLVGTIGGTLVYGVFLVPAWGFSRIVGHDPVERRSGWLRPLPIAPRDPDRDHRRAERQPSSRSFRYRQKGVRLRLGVLLVLTAGLLAWHLTDPVRHPPIVGYSYWPEAFEGQPDARAVFDDQARYIMNADPFTQGRNRDHQGAINVRDGSRVSYQAPNPELTVWFLGGSTMFGIGQRDLHTIPSDVARLAEADGHRLRVVNLGTNGWGVWQESIEFARRLGTQPDPDLVVFLDGINDMSTFQRLMKDGRDPTWPWASHFDLKYYPKPSTGPQPGLGTAPRQRAVRQFAATLNRAWPSITSSAQQHGITVMRYWHPILATLQNGESNARILDRLDIDPSTTRQNRAEYVELGSLVRPRAVDLTRAFDGLRQAPYFDWTHTNERGSQAVADAMYVSMEPVLERLDPHD